MQLFSQESPQPPPMSDLYRETAMRYGAPINSSECTTPAKRARSQTQNDFSIYATPSAPVPNRSSSYSNTLHNDEDKTEPLVQV